MRTVSLVLDYWRIEDLINLIDEPNRAVCHLILQENRRRSETVPGSRHNHQAWPGGYIDHITDAMNYGRHLYAFDAAFCRPLPFSLADVMLVLFLHDVEKLWREEMNATSTHEHATKVERQVFREQKFVEYGLILTAAQENGLMYVEGEILRHSATERVMNELAAFCHKVDVWSARGWYDYPKAIGDEWTGVGRLRVTGGD